jgi:dTDP-glucose pyrophosphorylase/predicted transcriptional regulator
MKDLKKIQVTSETTIRETIQRIDASALQIALVTDNNGKLLGTVTDGDIRRGILRGLVLDEAIRTVMNNSPQVCRVEDSREANLARMKCTGLHHMPILDDAGCLIGLETLDELVAPIKRDNLVILMAGGLGTRLRPLTDECPKPMLKIGGRPILETILLNFIEGGFKHFLISVNYKSEIITDYFGDGSNWGVEIQYIHEHEKLGTAGALGLLTKKPNSSFLVMNGDLLTKINFNQLLDFHRSQGAQATMCVREYDFQVPYGVVKIDKQRITSIDEKPTQRFFVNAGVYVLEPETLNCIPINHNFDMPTLFQQLIKQEKETAVFPIREYWLDVGHLADFERANGEYWKFFS